MNAVILKIMTEELSKRRMTENEMVFRKFNEQVPKKLEALKKAAQAEGHGPLMKDIDMPLHFYCECADENCRKRLVLKPNEYKDLHKNTSQFIIIPGHEVSEIERVVFKNDKLMVVEKHQEPPQGPTKLNPTPVDNL